MNRLQKAAAAGGMLLGAVMVGPARPASDCSQGLCGGEYLAPFFAKLQTVGHAHGERPLLVLQIGDSHSAGDNISGAWRDMLQARYGAGGRGVLPPGNPFDGYRPRGVTVAQSAGWTAQSLFDSAFRNLQQHAIFGVSGYRLTAEQPGAQLTFSADTPSFSFDRLVVCAVNAPGAGGYTLTMGEVRQQVTLDATDPHVACMTFQSTSLQEAAQLSVDAGTVTLTSWAVFSDSGGIAVSNLGVVGSQLKNFADVTDDQAVGEELKTYQPDLLVIEFGTNEGFVGHFDPEGYEANLRNQIKRLRRLSGDTPILLLSAPDADTNRRDLIANGASDADRSTAAPGEWFPPPALAEVREIQRRVAAEMGLAWWNWSGRMGGPATAQRWANQDPPLMRRDRVHYTVAGGLRVAGLLEDDLEAAEAAAILSDP